MTQVSTGSRDYQQHQQVEEEEEEEESVAAGISSIERLMNNLLINLPEDVLIKYILLKVPMNSLLNLRYVSKYLWNLITSPAFTKMHFHHSTTTNHELNNQLVLVNSIHHLDLDVFHSLKFNDGTAAGDDDQCFPEVIKFVSPIESPHIWGSCDGLLCLTVRHYDDRVCLWNPFTKEYKDLPPPLPLTEIPIGITKVITHGAGSITYGFGYDRFIDDYKIIRCENFVGRRRRRRVGDGTNDDCDRISITEFQVYTLGTNTWRKISTENNPYKSCFMLPSKSIVFVNGALYWNMSTSSEMTRTEFKIVSFDIKREVFREIQRPLITKQDQCSLSSVIRVLGDCLCLFEFDGRGAICFNVWMMMDYGVKESWTKLFTIFGKEVESLHRYLESCYRLLRFCDNGEIVIAGYDILFIYDPINNKARVVEFGERGTYLYQSEIYIKSLVSLNSGVYKG